MEIFTLNGDSEQSLNALLATVSAGEPLTAVSEIERIDANALLARGSDSCLLIRVNGESLIDVPIASGDWVVVDRARAPQPNDVVLAYLNGGYTLKIHKISRKGKKGLYLVPANDLYETREVNKEDEFDIYGVLTHVIHSLI